ncbi:MAG: beta-propeller fold lactonase family protein [Planctomycetes bacterium]|nr:beta-propeller fold lactonase family protein [Planctomycetota bacterium]
MSQLRGNTRSSERSRARTTGTSLLRHALLPSVCALALALWCGARREATSLHADVPPRDEPQPDRSPYGIAVSPDGRWCATANRTADSISLIDLQSGRVALKHRCGREPLDVAWYDAGTLLVSLSADDAVAVLRVDETQGAPRLTMASRIRVGDDPRGLAVPGLSGEKQSSTAARPAFVAVSGADEVAVLDPSAGRVTARIAVGGLPRTLALSPDGRWLVTCCNRPGEVWVHDAATLELVSRRNVFDDGFNLGPPVIEPDSSAVVVAGVINRTFPVSEANIEKGWVIDNRLTRLPLPDGEYWKQQQLGLDPRGNACGDAWGLARTPDGRRLAVSCGGSHELLILDNETLRWPTGDPGDFLPPEMIAADGAVRRVELGGRPLAVAAVDERTVVVANYLANAVDVVDLVAAKRLASIPLGGPAEASLVRRGEAIFYDADRSFDSWFSCHTCHTEGGTSGQTFDTLNDGNYDTHKLTPALYGVAHTGPWMWHGTQATLEAAVKKSMRDTLSTRKPFTDDEAHALLAFLATLEAPVSPQHGDDGNGLAASQRDARHPTRASRWDAAKRGRALFEGKAGCTTCHTGEHFTTAATYTVGLESRRYFHSEFNPPSLAGLHARRRFLHDGRADTLEEVLIRHHRPEQLAGERLSDEELSDLIAWLKSL